MIDQAQSILRETFGYECFRPLQGEVISQVLQRKDTLVIMPTGGGKSLCYQIPAMLFDGLTVVVSPLISLMKDQVGQLDEYGVPAVFLNSTLGPDKYIANAERVRTGEAKMLYVAPETLLNNRTRDLLAGVKVDCFTIDEAHCISEWGHDFRPEYRQLAAFRRNFPEAVCLALTATATPRVREDIRTTLQMDKSEVFVAGFDRANLFLEITPKVNPLWQILDFIKPRKEQSGIIYCFSRRQVDELTSDLESHGYSVRPYHAGLKEEERTANQEAFIRDDALIIVATIAFGMGINKPDVRYVIHHDLPQNIESYYQQIGRAGRDGEKAHCLLLYNHGDTQKIRYFIDQKPDKEKLIAQRHLDALVDYIEGGTCRRPPLLRYFGEEYNGRLCEMCDKCLTGEDKTGDVTEQARKFLSCVVRTGETFGAAYISDILRGSEAKKVLSNGHHNLSTHGIGREWPRQNWIQLSRLLIRSGFLHKDPEYGQLRLTPAARGVLKGDTPVMGSFDTAETNSLPPIIIEYDRYPTGNGKKAGKKQRFAQRVHEPDVAAGYNAGLFEELRKLRKKMADQRGIPPYAIFPDRTLKEMAARLPQNLQAMATIHGVGATKLHKYGDAFLGEIRLHIK
ncbi:MAG: DNA helicase RecQ [Balneolaceae bacterium]|nr:MAG: DNA helicase RecQ [Balneolaceae bacterium]